MLGDKESGGRGGWTDDGEERAVIQLRSSGDLV